jgi:VanZ family protein
VINPTRSLGRRASRIARGAPKSPLESLPVSDTLSRQTAERTASAVLGVYWLLLLTATHWPREILPHESRLLAGDKLAHFSAYAGLGFLLMLVARLRQPSAVFELSATLRQLVRLILFVSAAGFIDEATQPIFGRDFELLDWLADSTGGLIGTTLAVVALGLYSAGRVATVGSAGSHETTPPAPPC